MPLVEVFVDVSLVPVEVLEPLGLVALPGLLLLVFVRVLRLLARSVLY